MKSNSSTDTLNTISFDGFCWRPRCRREPCRLAGRFGFIEHGMPRKFVVTLYGGGWSACTALDGWRFVGVFASKKQINTLHLI